MNNKAQSEIIGLMIIVVIITIGMLFYLAYATNQSERSTNENIRKEFVDNELSMGFVQTLIRTSVAECNDLPLDLLIKDCGLDEGIIQCEYGLSTCDAVSIVLQKVKESTLDTWDKSYYLAVDYGETSIFDPLELFPVIQDVSSGDIRDESCAPGAIGRRAPGVQPIPYYPEPGTAFLQLALCNKD